MADNDIATRPISLELWSNDSEILDLEPFLKAEGVSIERKFGLQTRAISVEQATTVIVAICGAIGHVAQAFKAYYEKTGKAFTASTSNGKIHAKNYTPDEIEKLVQVSSLLLLDTPPTNKESLEIEAQNVTRTSTRTDGAFCITITATEDPAKQEQIDFLRQLGYDYKNLTENKAAQYLNHILRPIDHAISHTFKNFDVALDYFRSLQIAISRSDYVKSLPRYGPNSTFKELMATGDPFAKVTKEQRMAVMDTAFQVIPPDVFLLLKSKGIERYKQSLDDRLRKGT